METSLRLRQGGGQGGGGGGLRIHAKEKLPIAGNALLQAHGEIHAATGAPTYLAVFLRHFYPNLAANLGLGIIQHFEKRKVKESTPCYYSLRAKKAIPFTADALLGINLKARLLADKHFNLNHDRTNTTAAVELAWTVLDLRRGQDVRLKLGCHLLHPKMPYFQLRENNWTFNACMDGKWDVRFDL